MPSKENPADYVSRGMDEKDLESEIWTQGPAFLWKAQDKWPEHPDIGPVTEEDPEVKMLSTKAVETREGDEDAVGKLISHYSSWSRLKRGVAWIQKTIQVLHEKTQSRSKSVEPEGSLMLEDVERAENFIIKRVQKRCFPEDLEAGRPVKMSSRIARLDPFLENDLMRVGGRLVNSMLDWNAKHPLILPRRGEVVDSSRFHDVFLAHRYQIPGREVLK